jgi:hypothetical protein
MLRVTTLAAAALSATLAAGPATAAEVANGYKWNGFRWNGTEASAPRLPELRAITLPSGVEYRR